MQYSLFSQFQGCLLGMVLGERLGLYAKTLPVSPEPLSPPAGWLRLAMQSAEMLGHTGQWDGLSGKSLAGDGFAIATLPLALFFHDNLVQQRHYLRQTVQQWGGSASREDAVSLFGYVIAQAIKKQLNVSALIPQLMAYLRVSMPEVWQRSPQIVQALELLQTGWEHHWSLQTTESKLATVAMDAEMTAIALALYCFLQTPDNFHLTIIQAADMHHRCSANLSPATCALAGAISGAHNSAIGIPSHWCISPLLQADIEQGTDEETSIHPHQKIQALSGRLLEAWSGIYHPGQLPINHHPVVAAPWIIRPR